MQLILADFIKEKILSLMNRSSKVLNKIILLKIFTIWINYFKIKNTLNLKNFEIKILLIVKANIILILKKNNLAMEIFMKAKLQINS